ncbi:MAG: M48 family metallopeptidase [Verrucomicrobia bacterium]|nr:M48 family metallopeptidase [Verrucomicrobiota bacterium]
MTAPFMDFFAKQETARRHTGRLLLLFLVAVVCIIAAVHVVVDLALKISERGAGSRFADPTLVVIDAGATLFVIIVGVAVTYVNLAAGGKAVAESCGGRRVESATRDPQERRLLNVVEEMAIASGVPVPPVFVLEEENGINAFAAGRTTSDAVVAVTRGALEQLTRDELQGVIGHEFSHILNGDMRLNLRLASWLGGIMGLAVIGEILIRVLLDSSSSRRSSSRDSKDSGQIGFALFIIGTGLFVIGYIGVFFARLIQAAVSRQREFLADASSVQFTRNPIGLATALEKIAGFKEGSRLHAPHAAMVRHMFFSNAAKPSWLDFIMSTHPPIEERIHWLDPSFNPEMAKLAAPAVGPEPEEKTNDGNDESIPGISALAAGRRKAGALPEQVRTPRHANLRQATGFVASLPEPLLAATRDSHGACAVVYALLLSDDPALRQQQLQGLRGLVGELVAQDLLKVETIEVLSESANKLSVLNLALVGLRRMDRAQFDQFHAALDYLIASDGLLDLFEFTLQKVLRRHLDVYFGITAAPKQQQTQLAALRDECVVLLSCLAHQGNKGDPARATAAYRAGLQLLALGVAPNTPFVQDACKLDTLDSALDKLNGASFPLKKKILAACAAVVSTDGQVRVEEVELLRAVSDSLDCPMPLTLASA